MNIGSLLTNIAEVYPDKPGITHGKKTLTYSQANARSSLP